MKLKVKTYTLTTSSTTEGVSGLYYVSKNISGDAPNNTIICFTKVNSYTDYDNASDASSSISGITTLYITSSRKSVDIVVEVGWLYR